MKVLFVTSEHPGRLYGGLGTFTREYTRELRKLCKVKVVYFHHGQTQPPDPDSDVDYVIVPKKVFTCHSIEGRILENTASLRWQVQKILDSFKPDVIHCNDRQTFMPFRFDDNVLYSSHLLFCDMLGLQGLDDVYFQELKIEKTAFNYSAITVVYSDFAAKRVIKNISASASPVVLPLAINKKDFYDEKEKDTLNVAYFGRFEDMQKGFTNFVKAVELLDKDFIKNYSVNFSLYGKGELPRWIDKSLFKEIEFLQGRDLCEAYAKTHIVVVPSRYEPFGLTGIEAMASGCLLLVVGGLGMDEYAVPGVNCLSIPDSPRGISEVIVDAVKNYNSYSGMRARAKADAESWTWNRCVAAHCRFYDAIKDKRVSNVKTAYRPETYNIIESYNKSTNVNYRKEENEALEKALDLTAPKENESVLVISLEDCLNKKNLTNLTVMKKNCDGVTYRVDFLPFKDNDFKYVIVAGAWETVINPVTALREICRISSGKTIVCFRKGNRLPWQTIQMEDDTSWRDLAKGACVNEPEILNISEYYDAAILNK